MMPRIVMCRLSLFALLSFIWIQPIQSQNTELSTTAISNLKLNNLIQGRIYFPDYRKIVGSQFLTQEWRVGKAKLLGEEYNELPLWYDIYTDELILLDWQAIGYGRISLNKEHVEAFEFDNRLFVNPNYSAYKKYNLKDEYYEVIGKGAFNLLINRSLETQQEENIDHFLRNDSKFLVYSDQIFKFKNKRGFLKAVPANAKDDISKYISKNKIRMKQVSDSEWIGLMAYMNELIQEEGVKDQKL